MRLLCETANLRDDATRLVDAELRNLPVQLGHHDVNVLAATLCHLDLWHL